MVELQQGNKDPIFYVCFVFVCKHVFNIHFSDVLCTGLWKDKT